jgi:hypothetical protein
MRLTLTKILFIFLLIPFTLNAQNRTIVGNWAVQQSDCTGVEGKVVIAPMSLNTDDFICKFNSVTRDGAKVTWQGTCTYHNEGKLLNPETVTAVETNGKLQLSFARNKSKIDISPLMRCK